MDSFSGPNAPKDPKLICIPWSSPCLCSSKGRPQNMESIIKLCCRLSSIFSVHDCRWCWYYISKWSSRPQICKWLQEELWSKGERKPGDPTYYLPHLKPGSHIVTDEETGEDSLVPYSVKGFDHPDIVLASLQSCDPGLYQQKLDFVLSSPNMAQYAQRRKLTGISKPSIFQGISPRHRLQIPGCFPTDLMHLVALYLTALLLSLYRGHY